MIFDEKKNLDFYRNLGVDGRYAKAVDFLQNTDLAHWNRASMRLTARMFMPM